ncbi:MAG: universal stress protein [Deltaproteobacteria bacterium]|nr:universal stress protein [Deltaproteobacteria bacterium]
MITTILVPTDGSDYSKTSLEYGIELTKKLDAQLKGLCVLDIKIIQGPLFNDISGFIDLSPYQEFTPLIESGLNERAESILHNFQERCEKAGLRPALKKVTGLVDESIIEEGKKADLIILAQRGEHYPLTGVGLLGSTSEAVVRKAGKPVIVTPIQYKEIKKMGLAYDESKPSEKALQLAIEFCMKTRWPLSILLITNDTVSAEKIRQKVESFFSSYDIEHDFDVRKGKEEQEILQFIEDGSVDLLFMGAYGHSRLRELILGSTTSYVIRKSSIPVLLVR